MTKDHLKRINAPRTWPIERKSLKFITRPNPGGHSFDSGMSLGTLLRDMLKHAKNLRDVKNILFDNEILVDSKRVKEHKRLIGLMDVLEIPKIKEAYRLLFNEKGKLELKEIKEGEAKIKPCKVIGKTLIKQGRLQLNLHDGKNIIIKEVDCRVGDTVILDLPKNNIKDVLKLDVKNYVYLIGGKHTGNHGKIEKVKKNMITYKSYSGVVFETLKKYAFVIGKDKPAISLIK